MDVLEKDFEREYFLINEHGKFHPEYTCDAFILLESNEYQYVNLVITKTAEEMYQEWLMDKDKPPTTKLRQMEDLERENKQLWDTVEMLLKTNGFLPSEDPIYRIKE